MKPHRFVSWLFVIMAAPTCAYSQTEALWSGVDGDYSDASNWSTDPDVPCNDGSTYDVTVNVAGADVLFDLSSCTVDSFLLGGSSTFTILKGTSYTVLGQATIGGTMTAAAGGSVFTGNGVTTIDNANLYANGGTLTLTGATSYTNTGGSNADRYLRADGSLSVLDLSAVTTIRGSDAYRAEVFIQALNGGSVNLMSAGDVGGGAVQVLAQGESSVVDISAMATFHDTNPDGSTFSSIGALDGGTVLMGNLTDLNDVDLTLDGTGTLSTAQITYYNNGAVTATDVTADFSAAVDVSGSAFNLNGGLLNLTSATNLSSASVTLTGGATANLGGATNIDNASFYVYDSVTTTLPSATSYTNTGGSNADRYLRADGLLSVLDLSAVTTIRGSDGYRAEVFIEALNGGSVNLGFAGDVGAGAVQILAQGENSVVDISAMATFHDTNPDGSTYSRIRALDGGTVLMGNLTDLNDVDLTLDGTGTASTGQVRYYTNGTVTATEVTADFSSAIDVTGSTFNVTGGLLDLTLADNLNATSVNLSGGATAILGPSNIDDASFFINDGVTVSLPNATSYASTGGSNADRYLRADGSLSVLDLSAVTTIRGSDGYRAEVFIEALNGGSVNLGSAGDVAGGAVQVLSQGENSVVDISAMATFHDTNPDGSTYSRIRALDGGTVLMGNLTDLNDVDLTLDGTGTMSTAQITYYNNGAVTATDVTADFSAAVDVSGSAFNLNGGLLNLTNATNLSAASVTLTGGATANLGGATNIDNASFYVYDSVTTSLPNATSYTSTGGNHGDRYLRADGLLSVLDLSGVTTIRGSDGYRAEVFIEALNGGLVNLSSAGDVAGGAVRVLAQGANSVVDISAMTTFRDTNPDGATYSRIQAQDGGAVQAANLQAINEIQLVRADGENSLIDLSALVNFVALATNASLEAKNGGTLLAGSLEQLNGVDVTLSGPSQMTLGNPVVVTGANFNYEGGTLTGSVTLVNSNLNNGPGGTGAASFTMQGDSTLSGNIALGQSVVVQGGGFGPANVSATAGFVNSGEITLESINGGLASNLSVETGLLENAAGGVININPGTGGDRTLAAELDNRGEIHVATFDNKFVTIGRAGDNHVSSGSFTINATELDSVVILGNSFTNLPGGILAGVGVLDVSQPGLESDGFVRPGLSTGKLEIAGDYTQSTSGTLEIEIGGLAPADLHDVLGVSAATLGGNLHVTLINGYAPATGESFDVVTAGILTGATAINGTFEVLDLPPLTATWCWDVSYSAKAVTLTVLGSAITQHPADRTGCADDAITFEVVVDGNIAVSYQWRKDGLEILGATDSTYTIDPATPGDAGNYDVVVTNSCGSETSTVGTLTVETPGPGDLDVDCDVDLGDFEALADCMAGPNATPNPTLPGVTAQNCLDAFDFDEDSDVDLQDSAAFQIVYDAGD